MKKRVLLLVAFSMMATNIFSQEVYGEPNVWFLLLTHYKINDHWSLGNEVHMRFDDYLNDKQQFILRPFINFGKTKEVVYSVGYSYLRTYPYGKYPIMAAKPEHNVWEQVTFNHQVNELRVSHRYRLEQRWQSYFNTVGGATTTDIAGYSKAHRFRYRLTLRQPIAEKLFINIFDELWVKSDAKVKTVQFDRNWLYAGVGVNLSEKASLQLAYLHQYMLNTTARFERHHTVQLTAEISFAK